MRDTDWRAALEWAVVAGVVLAVFVLIPFPA